MVQTQTQTIELPTGIYTALVQAANEIGVTPVAWIALHLPENELNGWDLNELRRMVAVSQEHLDRGEYLEYYSAKEMTQVVLTK